MNIWAIVVAAVSSFLLGGLWYSPVFLGNAWNRENGGPIPPGHPAKVFGVSFAFSLLAAAAFAWWLGRDPGLSRALQLGFVAGFCFVAASFGINYQFANRSFLMWAIDGGYHTVQFVTFALVLSLWP